jgi:hypothetical protein
MAVNYQGKKFYSIGPLWQTVVNYYRILTLENEGNVVNYRSIFMTLASDVSGHSLQ